MMSGTIPPELSDLTHRHEQLRQLYQVSKVIHSSLDPREALELILDQTVRLMRASSASVALYNPTSRRLEIEASRGLPPDAATLKLRLGEGITGWVAKHAQPARVGDVRNDARYVRLRDNVRSELAVPFEVQGEVRGVLNVDSDVLNAFDASHEELLAELASQAALVIQNTWRYQQIRSKARLFESLASVGQIISSTLSVDDALRAIAREACLFMEAKMCSLHMLDDSRVWLDLRASHGAGPNYLANSRNSVEESFLGIVLRRKRPMQLENVQLSNQYQNAETARTEGLISLLSTPLIYDGQPLGTISIYSGQPHSFSNEEILALGAFSDLSAIALGKARLYERVVDMEEQLRQNEKLSAIGLLAAEIAHEIRNPLTVMKMLYHSLELTFPEGDPRTKDAEIVRDKMDHLNKIVEQVLHYARNTEPQLAPLDLNELIADLGLLTRHKLRNQGVTLERDLDPHLPHVCADATQLEQAFLNLTLNAAEAMPDGGRLSIATRQMRLPRHSPETTHVLIQFKDTGEGMSEEQRRRAFSSLLSTTKRTGTGLGLAIVAKVVEVHHGRIRVRSRKGQGTTISIILPVSPGA